MTIYLDLLKSKIRFSIKCEGQFDKWTQSPTHDFKNQTVHQTVFLKIFNSTLVFDQLLTSFGSFNRIELVPSWTNWTGRFGSENYGPTVIFMNVHGLLEKTLKSWFLRTCIPLHISKVVFWKKKKLHFETSPNVYIIFWF